MTLRFCANLKWQFNEFPFEDRFEAAAKAGFAAVEYASPYEIPAAELSKRLRGNGLRQVLINTPMGTPDSPVRFGAACRPEMVTVFRDGVMKALEYAAELECGMVHVMAGEVSDEDSRNHLNSTYLDNLSWAADIADAAGVKIAVEAINPQDRPNYFIQTQEEAVAAVEYIGRDRAATIFDVYHCAVSQGDVVHRLGNLLPWVGHIQVADVPHRGEPGTGTLPWRKIFDQLREGGYNEWIGCEYSPFGATIGGLVWQQELT